MRLSLLLLFLFTAAACTDVDPVDLRDDDDDDSAAGDDDSTPADDDDSTPADDDDSTPADDDDSTPADDDDSTPADDDDSTPADDDDSTPADDDDSTPADDDDSTPADDDDSTPGDDDTTPGDDDSAAGDDDSASGDDDSATGDDDDSAVPAEDDCFDGLDGDADGDTDCGDSDCAAEPGCASCAPDFVLTCGASDTWANNNAGATDAVDNWSCTGWDEDGPEYTYSFQAPYDGTAEFQLSGMTVDLDIFVTDGSQPCSGAGCLGYGNESVTTTLVAGANYLVTVDGYQGAVGGYTLDVSCTPSAEQDCADGLDDDADSAIDCDDTDCAGAVGCVCAVEFNLVCSDSDTWSTLNVGATDAVDLWACSSWDESGPEYTYSFTAPADGEVTVDLSGLAGGVDLDLFVAAGSEPCDGASCLTHGDSTVTFAATIGEVYTVTVDGYLGAAGDYTIGLDCATPEELDCTDGVDGDGDALVDCADSDCGDSLDCQCVVDATLSCGGTDSWDTTGVGATDVIDLWGCSGWNESGPEYTYTVTLPYDGTFTASLSGMAVDLDLFVGDGALPCAGANCLQAANSVATWSGLAGEVRTLTVDGYDGASGAFTIDFDCVPNEEQDCDDGIDDDGDGDMDCFDADCAGDSTCTCVSDFALSCGGSDSYNNSDPGSTDAVDSWTCVGWDESGPEYTYSFTAPYDADVTVNLSGMTADLDVFVGDGTVSCGTGCVDYGDSSTTFTALGGETFTFTVDGYGGAIGDYTIDVNCAPNEELDCGDGLDDDGDSDFDCDDSDCASATECTCADDFTLSCGGSDSWSNNGGGSTDNIDQWACVGWDESGPEYTYSFTPTSSGTATVTLSNMSADLDVFVLDSAIGCTPGACFNYGDAVAGFAFTAGVEYLIAVDGFQGATSAYDIDLSCTP